VLDHLGGPRGRGERVEVVSKRILVARSPDARPALYRVSVEGFQPILAKEHLLGHVLGLLMGPDAAGALKTVIYGPTGQLEAHVWVNPAQTAALQLLIGQYRSLSR
jgi:hypothetical protein